MTPPATAPPGGTSPAWAVDPSGPLRGEVRVAGSKNAVTKHMVAAVMGSSPSSIANVPDIGDVGITTEVLESLAENPQVPTPTQLEAARLAAKLRGKLN